MINPIFNDYNYVLLPKQLETYEKYSRIIRWGRQHPIRFLERFMNLEFLDHQKYIFMMAWRADVSVILASRSSGKACTLDTPVYSVKEDGPKNIGEVKVGDLIYDMNGLPTEVIKLNPIVFDDVYEVEFDDGEKIKCNKDHLWLVYDSLKDLLVAPRNRPIHVLSTEQMTHQIRKSGGAFRYSVPLMSPIQHSEKDFIIEPYLLGLWISDGKKDEPFITCEAKDLDEQLEILNSINKNGWIFTKRVRHKNYGDIIISHKDDKYSKNGFKKYSVFLHKLRELNVYGNKHIPEEYFEGSIQQRMDLLQGLYDADGSCQKKGRCVFFQKKDEITNGVDKLLYTLGIKHTVHIKESFDKRTNKTYRTSIIYSNNDTNTPFFKLKRKLENQKNVKQSNFKKSIVDIRKLDKKEAMRCITVNNNDGSFICGNHYTVTHNSYLATPFIMARSLLYPNHNSYLMAPSGQQSQLLFQKLEDLAKGQIASALGVSTFFLDECVRINAKADPFTHSKQSYTVELYNGSTVNTLNSVAKNIVGVRSNLNVYDEAGKIEKDFFALTTPFVAQDSSFITGKNVNAELYPTQQQNKIMYLSSAESTSTELFTQYKLCFERMLCGDPKYFACDIDCNFSLHPFKDGKPTMPLITEATVKNAMETNPYRAYREYYNLWDNDGSDDVFIKRSVINKNTQVYYPEYKNDGTRLFIFGIDPASRIDNSMVMVGELLNDEKKGLMVKLSYARNLIETLANGKKQVIQRPEQIEIIKDLIADFNLGYDDYDGIVEVTLDGGAGGGGFDIGQFLMNEWKDKHGKTHKGLIDPNDQYMSMRLDDYPENIKKLRIFNFKRDKATAYERTQNAINQGLVIFPASLNPRNELEFTEEQEDGTIKVRYEKVSKRDMGSLVEFDILKEEIVNTQKVKRQNGTVSFELTPTAKSKNMHDDRIDCLVEICNKLMELRAEQALKIEETESDFKDYFKKAHRQTSNEGKGGPFTNKNNPFNNNNGMSRIFRR